MIALCARASKHYSNFPFQLPILQKSSGSKAPEATKTAKNPTGIRNIRPNQNEPPLACDKCPRKFFVQHRYDAHMRRHNGLKGFKCEHCDKAFQKSCTLKAHVEVHHWDESKGKPEYICGIDDCGKKYSRKVRTSFGLKYCVTFQSFQ